MSKIDNMLIQADEFAKEFLNKISDKNEQPARKQAFFLDSHEDLGKCMGMLQTAITKLSNEENGDLEQGLSPEDTERLEKATLILNSLRVGIAEYQKEFMINDDITEEETTTKLTEDSIKEAMISNKTTQDIAANMEAISNQKKSCIPYNYVLVCDGVMNFIDVNTKEELNQVINTTANSGNYSDIQLYKVSFSHVQLKKKTILSV